MRVIIAHWIPSRRGVGAAVRSRARCGGILLFWELPQPKPVLGPAAVDPGERALHAPASGQHERAEHRVPAHGERGHRRGADGDEGKIASQVSAARRWIDGAVRGDESEGPGSGRVRWASLQPPIVGHYSQMYSSAMAPSCHLARVTIRLPFSSSPTTQVQSPEPNPIGWDLTWTGRHRCSRRRPSLPRCAHECRASKPDRAPPRERHQCGNG